MKEKTILCEVHLFDLFLKGSSWVRDSNQSGYLFWHLLTTPKIILAIFFHLHPIGWNRMEHYEKQTVDICHVVRLVYFHTTQP